MNENHDKLRKGLPLIALSFAIFVLGVSVSPYFENKQKLLGDSKKIELSLAGNADGSLNQQGSDSNSSVLGFGSNAPQIFVSDTDGYRNGGVINLASIDEPSVKITSYNYKGNADVSVYRADEDGLVDYLTHDKDGKQIKWNNPDISRFQHVANLNYQVQDPNSSSRLVLPLEEKGIWLLRISAGSFKADAFILRSDFGAVAKEGDNEFIFWGQSYQTKRSITDGSIRVYNLLDGKQTINATTFNEAGISRTPISPNADIAIVERAGSKALIPLNLRYLNSYYGSDFWKPFDTKTSITKYFVFTDRPIYKPGDTVYFKVILRDDDDARYSIPDGIVRVAVARGWVDAEAKNTVFQKTYSISGDGTVYGEFKLPEDAATDSYSLRVDRLPIVNDYWSSGSSTYFQVQYFRKPEYSIEVNTPKIEYISGDKTSFKINGRYFSGQALTGQAVKYSITAGDFYEYTYYSSSMNSYLSDDYRYGWFGGEAVSSGEAILDENGQIEIDLNTKIVGGKSRVFSIEAEFDDGSGNPSFSRKNVLVYSGEYGIYKKTWEYGGLVGKPLTLDVQLVSRTNTNVNNLGLEAKVKRENWIQYLDPNEKYPLYRKEEEDLPTIRATSNNNGEAKFTFIPQKVGSYKLTVLGKDIRDNSIIKEFHFWVDDTQQLVYWGNFNNQLSVKGDKDQYLPTDAFKLTITSDIPDRDVLLSFERGRVNRFQIVKINGNKANIEVPIASTDIPNIYAVVSSFSGIDLDQDNVDLPVSAESKRITINLAPDKKKIGPGDNLTVNIQTLDQSGSPVSAEVAVWMVDKAIFELMDTNLGEIFKTFWQQRGNSTNTAHSLEGIIVQTAEGGGCFTGETAVLLPGNKTKEIKEIKAGDLVLTRENETGSELVSAKVNVVHEAEENGYLIINGSLKVTPDHYLWVNNGWKEAGSIQEGDDLIDSFGDRVNVYSIEWVLDKVKVYNLEIEKYKTFFANGVWVHNQKGDGGSRSVFKDTAYWNPSVRTDTSGKAQIIVKVPDNLTTWVVSAVGSTTDTKVGQIKDEIVVTKDVIVRPILPNLIRTNDKIILSTLVQNFTDTERNFMVGLDFDSGVVKPTNPTEVLIKPKETKQLYWEVVPQKENENAKFTFSALAKDDSKIGDTVVSVLPILKFGFMENKSEVGEGPKDYLLRLSADSDPDKTKVTLNLSPSLIGTLPVAMKYLIWYPYGCVEQTTSRFVPTVIAKSNPDLFSESLPDVNLDDVLKKGVKRLGDLQNWDGGWQWWSHGRSSSFVTAYVIEYLLKAKNVGVTVDQAILDRAQGHLGNDIYWDPVAQMERGYDRDDKVARVYALSLLGSDKGKVLLRDFDNITPDILSLAIMANVKNGDTNPATNGLSLLLSQMKTQEDGVFWLAGKKENFGSIDTSTAFAIRAIVAANGDKNIAAKAVRFLTRSRKAEYWSNTFATSQVIRGLVDYSRQVEGSTPNFSYKVILDGKQIANGQVNGLKQILKDIVISPSVIKPEGSTLSITKEGNGQIYSLLSQHEYRTDFKAKSLENGLSIKKEYIDEKGQGYSLAVGDLVTVRLTVNGLAVDENYGIINDELPAGMIPVNLNLKNEQYNADNQWYYDSYGVTDFDITRNGAVLSVYKMGAGERTYEYKARVVSEGTFLVPPASVSLMYAPEIYGRSEPQTVTTTGESVIPIDKKVQKVVNVFVGNKQNIIILIATIFVAAVLLIIKIFWKNPPKKDLPKEEEHTQNIYP